MKSITLGSKTVSVLSKPYVIAEIGVNHGGSIDLAKEMISAAKRAGADAAKFQSYKAEKLVIKNSPAYWDLTKEGTKTQHELFKKYDIFNDSEYIELAQFCRDIKIDFASTPFDLDAVQYLDPVVAYFKVASADLCNIPLLEAIAETGKPIILSTGASTIGEIKSAVSCIRSIGENEIAILHCILNYPTANKNANLLMLTDLIHEFPDSIVGLSDHSVPDGTISAGLIAYSLGARIIEKHFTLDKNLSGNDHYHSMDESDLKEFVNSTNEIHSKLGQLERKQPLESESESRKYARRSIVAKRDISKGEILSVENLTVKRPGTGIGSEKWHEVLGTLANSNISADSQIRPEDIS